MDFNQKNCPLCSNWCEFSTENNGIQQGKNRYVSSNDQSHNCFYPSLVPNNNQHLQEGASHFNRFVGNQPPEPMSIPPYPAQQYPVYDVNGQANFIESREGQQAVMEIGDSHRPFEVIGHNHNEILIEVERSINEWKKQQSLYSIGPFEAQHHYFEQLMFGSDLNQRITAVGMGLVGQIKNASFGSVGRLEIIKRLQSFISQMVVIKEQPPCFYVCGSDMPKKRSKYWFDVSMVVIAADFFQKAGITVEVKNCYLQEYGTLNECKDFILANDAIRNAYLNNAKDGKTDENEKKTDYWNQCIVLKQDNNYFGCISNLSIIRRGKLDRRAKMEYQLVFQLQFAIPEIEAPYGIELASLPLLIITNKDKKQQLDSIVQRALYNNRQYDFDGAMEFIHLLFQRKLKRKVQKFKGATFELISLSQRSQFFLLETMLSKTEFVSVNNVDLQSVNMLMDSGENEPFTFIDWLFGAAKIVCETKSTYEMWKKGCIFGFCPREDAEKYVKQGNGAILIRFANREMGVLSLEVLTTDKNVNHGTISKATFKEKSFESAHFSYMCEHIKNGIEKIRPPLLTYFGSKIRIIRLIFGEYVRLKIAFESVVDIIKSKGKNDNSESSSSSMLQLDNQNTQKVVCKIALEEKKAQLKEIILIRVPDPDPRYDLVYLKEE